MSSSCARKTLGSLAALVAIACSVAAVAQAEERANVQLAWRAPAECPDRARVLELVREAAGTRSVVVSGHVVRARAGFALSLRIESGTLLRERSLHAASCTALVESASFLVALALQDPPPSVSEPARASVAAAPDDASTARAARSGENEPVPPRAAPPATPSAATEARELGDQALLTPDARPVAAQPARAHENVPIAATTEPTEATRATPAPRTHRLGARVGIASGVAVLGFAGSAPELSGELALTTPWLDLELRLGHVFRRTRTLAGKARVAFDSQYLALLACKEWSLGRFALGPCGILTGLLSHARPRGLGAAVAAPALWMTAGVGARARIALVTRLSLALDAALSLPLSARPVFDVSAYGAAGQAAFVSASVRLALGVQFE